MTAGCTAVKRCWAAVLGSIGRKGTSRWKVLRKQEEKDAYLQGKLVGEIFVFDRLESKGGQKVLQGHLFNLERSQVLPIEIAAGSQGKNGQGKDSPLIRKGKTK